MKKATLTLLMSVTFLYFACANEQSMDTKIEEIWKDVVGYEGLYQVSNRERIKSLKRIVRSAIRNNLTVIRKERFLKLKTTDQGYKSITLYDGIGGHKIMLFHRAVAMAFIPNPNNLPFINHKKGKSNVPSNLEWCTQSYNIQYAYDNGTKKPSPIIPKYGADNHASRAVRQFTLSGEIVKEWECISYIQRDLGFNRPNICKVCRGKQNTAYGFKWEYV